MSSFPRTTVGGVSVSRMIIGTNWFLGFSHATAAKDDYIRTHVANREKIADIIEVYLKAGVDTIMGLIQRKELWEGIQEAQQRTGKKLIVVSTPGIPLNADTPTKGFGAEAEKIFDEEKRLGATFCFPHTSTTDCLIDKCTRKIRHMDQLSRMIRARGMIPGLSTHMPESIIFADESGVDVETYISLYNAMGFLMQVEVDWIQRVILKAKKPVMTIKPMAAGQLRPFQAFNFVWNTLRPQDMVTVGTMAPREAQECIDISLGILERRQADFQLQETRSKATIKMQA
ncbi:MAG: hypothetical protein A3K19_23445 [Lentisphaerae bacterium RIFOXYB12_FULL_65_16]|nr:MAG: hypothetical protein A3K18_20655 [Lentisphaerae bacterium RIFOXYA12_64_32]OGV91224.1 MAG: hypothetical protein A3K19_23445 [Lentisphaerae bacterium RIFOXYB12_FULL_65_16]